MEVCGKKRPSEGIGNIRHRGEMGKTSHMYVYGIEGGSREEISSNAKARNILVTIGSETVSYKRGSLLNQIWW